MEMAYFKTLGFRAFGVIFKEHAIFFLMYLISYCLKLLIKKSFSLRGSNTYTSKCYRIYIYILDLKIRIRVIELP